MQFAGAAVSQRFAVATRSFAWPEAPLAHRLRAGSQRKSVRFFGRGAVFCGRKALILPWNRGAIELPPSNMNDVAIAACRRKSKVRAQSLGVFCTRVRTPACFARFLPSCLA